MLIRHVPPDERPRERLLSEGPQSLSNQELLAILLRTGTKQYSVLTLAQHLLTHFEGLRQLKDATIEEMTSIKGIGKTKAIQIIAALELGRRVHQIQYDDRYVIRSPEDGARYVMEDMRFLSQEHFVVVYFS